MLHLFDLAPADHLDLHTERGRNDAWATVHVVSALQGIVNRDRPNLYVTYVGGDTGKSGGIDRFWLDRLHEPDGAMAGVPTQPVDTLEALIDVFRRAIRGVVLYDLRVPATSNVASTAAGCEDLLPIPYDPAPGSIYDRLIVNGPKLPVRLRLLKDDDSPLFTGSETGSAKNDAYRWAIRRYLESGRCDASKLGYYLDSYWLQNPTRAAANCHGLSNHDYFISRRAFFFDLSPWDDELPQDEPTQPRGADFKTLLLMLRTAYDRTRGQAMIHAGGFVPWAWKYTHSAGGAHGDVATEWRYAAVLSCFNAYMDADALGLNAMANASVFTHASRKKRYVQPRPTPITLRQQGYVTPENTVAPRTYVTFYVGDYDSAAWLYQRLPALWNDPNRGKIPLGWAFNPNLADRFAVGLDWARRTATPDDHFISGDSGAGYLNPGNLDGDRPYSHLPSGLPVWEAHCARLYRQWDIGITGFVIDGDARPMSPACLAAYARFSPEGVVAQKLPTHAGVIPGTRTPYLTMGSDMPNGDQTDEAITRILAQIGPADTNANVAPNFHIFRTILWSPTQHRRLFERLQAARPDVAVVDPYTLMALLRQQEMSQPKAS